jgi:hypothetical protein
MSANHCLGRHGVQNLFPGEPELASDDPEEFVDATKCGSRVATFQHSELLSKCEVFQNEARATVKDTSECSKEEKKQVEHGRSYTKITIGRRGKLMIIWSVTVFTRDRRQAKALFELELRGSRKCLSIC